MVQKLDAQELERRRNVYHGCAPTPYTRFDEMRDLLWEKGEEANEARREAARRRARERDLLALEWAGAACGLLGAALLASNTALSPYGFAWFLCSSLALLATALRRRSWPLALLQAGFTVANLVGIGRWLL